MKLLNFWTKLCTFVQYTNFDHESLFPKTFYRLHILIVACHHIIDEGRMTNPWFGYLLGETLSSEKGKNPKNLGFRSSIILQKELQNFCNNIEP